MPRLAIVAAVVLAAVATLVVVSGLPREGEPGAPLATPGPIRPAATLALEQPATEADGRLEVLATAGGAPLAGAQVRAYRAVAGDGAIDWRIAGSGVTGADGLVQLAAAPGAYLVAVRAADLAPGHAVAFRPAGEGLTRAEVALAPPAALEGRIAGEDLPRTARAVVWPALDALGPGVAAPVEERTVVTVESGRFRAAGLAPGVHAVEIEAAGHPVLRLPRVAVPRAGAVEATLLPAAAAPPARAAASVPAGAGAVEGTVRDPSGAPLAGVRVRVSSRGDGLAGEPPFEVRTDFDGRFRIEGLPPGRAALVAHEPGVELGTAAAVRIVAGATAALDLEIVGAGVLAGRVAGPDGKPAPLGTEVVAAAMKAGPGAAQRARAIADASGNYRLSVPAGEYRVHAAAVETPDADLRVTPAFAPVFAGRTTRADLALAELVGEPATIVRVTEPGGAPSPGAFVTLARAGDARVALATATAEDGVARVPRAMGLAGQRVDVRVRAGGRSGAWTGAFPADGAIAIALAPAAAIEARVHGAGAGTVEVMTAPSPGAWRPLETHRFTNGRVSLADLPPEPVRLAFRTDEGRRASIDVALSPGEHRKIEVSVGSAMPAGLVPAK